MIDQICSKIDCNRIATLVGLHHLRDTAFGGFHQARQESSWLSRQGTLTWKSTARGLGIGGAHATTALGEYCVVLGLGFVLTISKGYHDHWELPALGNSEDFGRWVLGTQMKGWRDQLGIGQRTWKCRTEC